MRVNLRAISFAIVCVLTFGAAPVHSDESIFSSLQGEPGLRSASALVLDSQGNLIFGKDANSVRPIASITKLMTAMVVLDAGLDLDEAITITRADRDVVKLTGSRLDFGATLSRREMILLALMSSENRAASALGRTYPGGLPSFVAHMNFKARRMCPPRRILRKWSPRRKPILSLRSLLPLNAWRCAHSATAAPSSMATPTDC